MKKPFFFLDEGCKLNVSKTCRKNLGRLLNVLCTFNLCLLSKEVLTKSLLSFSKTDEIAIMKNLGWFLITFLDLFWSKVNKHCVKSIHIWSYSGPHFPVFALNTERYSVSLRIQSECGKIRTRITPNTNTFHVVKFIHLYRASL